MKIHLSKYWERFCLYLAVLIPGLVFFGVFTSVQNEKGPSLLPLIWTPIGILIAFLCWELTVALRMVRFLVKEDGKLVMYSLWRKEKAAISLDRNLYYEIPPLTEKVASVKEYLVLSNHFFLPFREKGVLNLAEACKIADAAGDMVILPYEHPCVPELLNRSACHPVSGPQRDGGPIESRAGCPPSEKSPDAGRYRSKGSAAAKKIHLSWDSELGCMTMVLLIVGILAGVAYFCFSFPDGGGWMAPLALPFLAGFSFAIDTGLKTVRFIEETDGRLWMYSLWKTRNVFVDLRQELYYEVLPLAEGMCLMRMFVIVSNQPFRSFRRNGAYGLGQACKAIDKSGKEIILPYHHPYVKELLRISTRHEVY